MLAKPLVKRLIEDLLDRHRNIGRHGLSERDLPFKQRIRVHLQRGGRDRRNALLNAFDKALQCFFNGSKLVFIYNCVDDREK